MDGSIVVTPHLIHASLNSPRVHIPNSISINSAVIALLAAESLYKTMHYPFIPSKLLLPVGESTPSSNTWFRGPTQVHIWMAQNSDRQTDRLWYSICNNRLHLCSTV